MEVQNTVQEEVTKMIPKGKKKKWKKENWLSEEVLQIAEKRREGQSRKGKDIPNQMQSFKE